jgi:hypothetical protein
MPGLSINLWNCRSIVCRGAPQQSTFNDNKPQQPFGIPRHPEALGSTSTDTLGPDYKNHSGFIVSAFTARGQYVLFQWAESTGDVGTPAELVARTLDMQGPLIDRFMPAAPSQFGDLPADPTGLLARTLPVPGNDAGINSNAVFEPRAFLHFADEPSKLADAFKQTGVQAVAVGLTTVYQAVDSTAAQSLADTETAITVESEGFNKPIRGVDGYPAAKCFSSDAQNAATAKFYCVAPADRFLIEALGQQDTDLRQQIAAQYLILTAH